MGIPWVGGLLGGGTSVLELWLSCAVVKVPKFVVFKNRRVNYSGSGTVTTGTLFPHSGERPEGAAWGASSRPAVSVCAPWVWCSPQSGVVSLQGSHCHDLIFSPVFRFHTASRPAAGFTVSADL